ncbi:MAG TPA: PAS domain-containing protein [Chitinophagaceae bacterium]|nr:PAS domain-containing protein [Chitinophagaceae bacterium]
MQELTATSSPLKTQEISAEEMKNFFMQAPAAMAIFSCPEFRYTSVNSFHEKLFGRKASELIGRTLREVWPVLDGQSVFEIFETVYKSGEPYRADEFPVRTQGKSGRTSYYNFILYPAKDETGKVINLMAHIYEVTAQVIANKRIQENNRQLNLAKEELEITFQNIPVGVYQFNNKGQIEYVNKKGAELMGFSSPEEFLKAPDMAQIKEYVDKKFILFDESGNETTTEKGSAFITFKTGKRAEALTRFLVKETGNSFWILSSSTPLYNEKGELSHILSIATDITRQKQAEQIIRESGERYKQLSVSIEDQVIQRTTDMLEIHNFLEQVIDASDDFVAVLDKGLRVITVNKKCEEVIKVESRNVAGKYIFDILHGGEGTAQHESMLKALEGETVRLEKTRSIASPEVFTDMYFIPLILKNKVEGVILLAKDVTDVVATGLELEKSNKQLNEAQQVAQLGSWEWDVVNDKLTWSQNMYHICGLNPDDGVDYEKFIFCVHPDDREMVEKHVLSSFEKKKFNDYYHRILTPSGEVKTLHGRGDVILNDEGIVIKMLGTGQEVTEERRVREKLIESNEVLEERNQFVEKLLDSSLDLITVVDKELRFIAVNKKAESIITAYYPGELIGRKITEVNPRLHETQYYEDLLKAFDGTVIIRDKEKSPMTDQYYEHNYVPLQNSSGEVYAVMTISHDITESVRQLEQLKKLAESDKLKSDFIKMASHELKTPVTSIKGYVQLLLSALHKNEEEKPLSPSLIKLSLVSIDKQISRLTRLLSELLDLSKIETGKLELNKEVFHLNELVIETVQDVLYSHTKHAINIFHDFGCNIYGDKDRIGQVLINLLTNAIKYSPDSDKVEVWIKQTEKGKVSISIKDFGIGISQKYHSKIFERFYRVEGKTEQTFPGFGIGLFLAKEIVEQHEGSISFTSKKNKGSEFTFTLPVASLD